MNYLKINTSLFILLNLLWAIVALPLSLYFLFLEDPLFQWDNFRWLILTIIMVSLQVVGYYKLREGNIYYAAVAVIVLSFIIDFDGFKLFNTLLLNIDMVYIAGGEYILQLRFLDGPSSTWNIRLTDFQFNEVGFNAVGFIQLYFLMEQESNKGKYSEKNISGNQHSDSESVIN